MIMNIWNKLTNWVTTINHKRGQRRLLVEMLDTMTDEENTAADNKVRELMSQYVRAAVISHHKTEIVI
jgi:hypothetical protein